MDFANQKPEALPPLSTVVAEREGEQVKWKVSGEIKGAFCMLVTNKQTDESFLFVMIEDKGTPHLLVERGVDHDEQRRAGLDDPLLHWQIREQFFTHHPTPADVFARMIVDQYHPAKRTLKTFWGIRHLRAVWFATPVMFKAKRLWNAETVEDVRRIYPGDMSRADRIWAGWE